MSVPRPLAWILLLAGLFVSGLLRQWHHKGPALVLLTILLALLFALLYRSMRGARLSAPDTTAAAGRVGMRGLLAFLILVVGEKWVTLVLLDPSLLWIPSLIEDVHLSDATYRLMTGLGLLGVCLGGLFLFRPLWPELGRLLSWRALAVGVGVVGGSLVMLYGILFLFLRYFQDQLPSMLAFRTPSLLVAVVLVGQTVRAASEELYFRGLLQEGLVAFLPRLGLRSSRMAKMAAIVLVSLVFGLEHADLGEASFAIIAGQLWFILLMSVLFGLALVVSRSLYLVMGFHLAGNLFYWEGVVFLDPRDASGIFSPQLYILLHAVLLFVMLFAVTGHRRRARRQAMKERSSGAGV